MMNKNSVNAVLLALIAVLVVSGCAKPQAADEMSSAPAPAPEMAVSVPQDEPEAMATDDQLQTQAIPVIFDKVYFAYDQSTLSEQARAALSNNAVLLQTAPELRVSIEGHCDDRGSDEYNLALGERRARAVRNFLVSLGVAPERLETISYGEEMPVDSNQNETAWAKNRRAEFKKLN